MAEDKKNEKDGKPGAPPVPDAPEVEASKPKPPVESPMPLLRRSAGHKVVGLIKHGSRMFRPGDPIKPGDLPEGDFERFVTSGAITAER